MLCIVMLSVIRLNVVMLSFVRLNVIILSVIRLSVIRLNVVMLNVVAPHNFTLLVDISAIRNFKQSYLHNKTEHLVAF